MKFNKISLFTLLMVFSSYSFALNTDEWVYQSITGDLKDSAGCGLEGSLRSAPRECTRRLHELPGRLGADL